VGDASSTKRLVQIDNDDISAINSKSNSNDDIFLIINFDSDNTGIKGTISNENDVQPIVIDLFSFGIKDRDEVNNAIYRFELEETRVNSGVFEGTMEYAITNQVNLNDPDLIKSLRTIDEDIKFLVSNRLLDEEGINIEYSDVAGIGSVKPTSSKSDISTHSGAVSFSSNSYRFGQPVIIRLMDPDLNLDSDTIETFHVINDPSSPFVDMVGSSSGGWLLEVKIKSSRYQRCMIDGIEYGGLAATSFALTETSRDSGIFEGSFKMPTKICNKDGTRLISPAGGSVTARYNDFRDSSGNPNIFETGRTNNKQDTTTLTSKPPKLNADIFTIPPPGQTVNVIAEGKIINYKRGIPVEITIIEPNGNVEDLGIRPTKHGNYRMVSTLDSRALPGEYTMQVDYFGTRVGEISFEVIKEEKMTLQQVRDSAAKWSSNDITDKEFLDNIIHLIDKASPNMNEYNDNIPKWVKTTAKWWSEGIITDDEFIALVKFLAKENII
jgi:hypothetical protein